MLYHEEPPIFRSPLLISVNFEKVEPFLLFIKEGGWNYMPAIKDVRYNERSQYWKTNP